MMQAVKSPNIPHEYPFVFKITENYIGHLVWCNETFGSPVPATRLWFESNGYFFFKNKADSLRFKIAGGCNIKNENVVHSYIDRIYDEFN